MPLGFGILIVFSAQHALISSLGLAQWPAPLTEQMFHVVGPELSDLTSLVIMALIKSLNRTPPK